MIEKILVKRIIKPWASPVILEIKWKMESCVCVNYRKLNKVIQRNFYFFPKVYDILDAMSGSKVFSTLDLASGYWQVEISPKDRTKIAFTFLKGFFQIRNNVVLVGKLIGNILNVDKFFHIIFKRIIVYS